MQLKIRPKISCFLRLSALLLSVSLVLTSANVGDRFWDRSTLAPHHQPFSLLEEPLTNSFLNEASLSEDLDERALAQTILSDQKKWSGLVFAFAAAFISALAITGQEVILKNVFMFHYLLLEPILMSLIFIATLLIFKKAKTPIILFSFFKTLRDSKTRGWFVASLLLAQMLLPFLFFLTLPLIGATSMNMIAALTLFFTLLFEWVLLGENKFQRRHILAFFLLFWGVVGFKMASATFIAWILLGVLIYLVASAENVIRKKVVENIGAQAQTYSFTLSFLIWNKLFSFGFWFFSLMVFGYYSGQNPLFVAAGGQLSLLGLLSSPLFFVVLITAAFLASASFLEQKTRTIKQFPVSILEAVRQTQVIYTAIIATVLASFSSIFSFPAFNNITSTTLSQWLFIPVLLSGVGLLSYFQREEELKEEKKNADQVLHPDGTPLTKQDWLVLLAEMEKESTVMQPKRKAEIVWSRYQPAQYLTKYKEVPVTLSEVEKYWRKEIAKFTPNELLIFKRAKQIKGLRIGFDLDGTIIPLIDDYSALDAGRIRREAHVSESLNRYREKIVLRPGIKPLLIGLMVQNYIEIDTASDQDRVDKVSEIIPFMEKLRASRGFKTKTRKEMLQVVTDFMDFKEVKIMGMNRVFANGTMLSLLEMENLYEDKSRIKLPNQLGLDILIEDNPLLKRFLERINYSGFSKIVTVRSYKLLRDRSRPFSVFAKLNNLRNGDPPVVSKTVLFSTEAKYEEEVLSILPLLERIKAVELETTGNRFDSVFMPIEQAV